MKRGIEGIKEEKHGIYRSTWFTTEAGQGLGKVGDV
jgi:hypothetical protein